MYEVLIDGICEVKVSTFDLAAKYCKKYSGRGVVQMVHNGVLVEFK